MSGPVNPSLREFLGVVFSVYPTIASIVTDLVPALVSYSSGIQSLIRASGTHCDPEPEQWCLSATIGSARLANIKIGGAGITSYPPQNENKNSEFANNAPSADLGLIGLAVMGQNLIMNMADHGFTICAFNRTVSKVDRFLENEAKGMSIVGAHSVEEFVSKLKSPRRVMLLVQAGQAVDDWIEKLLPFLSAGDIIIDGGNSHFPDSNRRTQYLSSKGLRFVGSGVSGGEEGARYGPSIMPGGNEEAWPHIKDIFQSISAKSDNEPCCEWVGDEGAGHYVKMVHNGIEYGDMQLICEAYDIMKRALGMSNKEMGDVFAKWNKGVLDSFLIEITRDIMYFNDEDGKPLVEKILDKAGQKGTGKWTAVNALDLGMPVTLIAESVLARCLSSMKDERGEASGKLEYVGRNNSFDGDKEQFLDDLEQALYASKIISYAQGFMLMQEAAKEFNWKLNKPSIALMWRGGCIIRSVFLKDITSAYRKQPDLKNLLFDDFFNKAIHKAQPGWRDVVAKAAMLGIPTPCFSTALSWFDGYRTKDLPANLLQAQRDYFGAHTFRIKPEHASEKYPNGQDIHVNWTGRGGNVSASTYQA
ncbi:NAD binding domain of 6-phosphogluconate dehydrogenase domain-containing protein [Sarocladium implicatum]|nr:NAD binding domain of 6-phosphogluconate dehydrogenase domain-containing protein [Sarocladium implicatum]